MKAKLSTLPENSIVKLDGEKWKINYIERHNIQLAHTTKFRDEQRGFRLFKDAKPETFVEVIERAPEPLKVMSRYMR